MDAGGQSLIRTARLSWAARDQPSAAAGVSHGATGPGDARSGGGAWRASPGPNPSSGFTNARIPPRDSDLQLCACAPILLAEGTGGAAAQPRLRATASQRG